MMAKVKNTLAYSADATVHKKKTFETALTLKLLGFWLEKHLSDRHLVNKVEKESGRAIEQ